MTRNPSLLFRRLINELIWLGPFVLLALISLTLFRTWVIVPPLATGRVILDGKDREAIIPEPFPGIVTGSYGAREVLTRTHAPESIVKVDGPRARPRSDRKVDLLWRIFPQIVRNDSLWDFPGDTESVLAKEAGYVHLGGNAFSEAFGMTVVDFGPASYLDKDEVIFTMTRVLNRIIGRDNHAEILIERYRRGFADLSEELRLETIAEKDRPRVLGMICDGWERVYGHADFDSRLGLRDPATGYIALGRESDAERILAMEPDVIVLFVGDSRSVLRDPRWLGMEAVHNGMVYSNLVLNNYTFDLDNQPLGARWVAELAYPDRLQPKLRDQVRDHYEESYGYRLSEEELDELLNVGTNGASALYERFMK